MLSVVMRMMQVMQLMFRLPGWIRTRAQSYLVSDHFTPLDAPVWNGLFVAVSTARAYHDPRLTCADAFLLVIQDEDD